MIDWWGTISLLGNWNIEKGISENVQGIVNFNCKPKSEYQMLCENATLDVRTGKISNGNQLQKLIITKNWNKIREYDYGNKSGQVSMIILITPRADLLIAYGSLLPVGLNFSPNKNIPTILDFA